jgi:hypothetical protein
LLRAVNCQKFSLKLTKAVSSGGRHSTATM